MTALIQKSGPLSTGLGCGSLLIWSCFALVVSELEQLPPFQTMMLVFGVSFLGTALSLTWRGRWNSMKESSSFIWIWGVVGVCGSDMAYIAAFKYAPPAHVDFIENMWPFFVILFSFLFTEERFCVRTLTGGLLGVLGLGFLLTRGEGLMGFQTDSLHGYLFALTASIIWGGYTFWMRRRKAPPEMIGMFCGIGALVAALVHYRYERWVTPTANQSTLLLLLGVAMGAAYFLWHHAASHGNLRLLSFLAYFTPIISLIVLVLCGKEPMSSAVVFAALFAFAGIFIARVRSA